MTPRAESFLRGASSEDVLTMLEALVHQDCDFLDLEAEHGHRVAYLRLTHDLFMYVDVGEQLFCGFLHSTAEVGRQRILQTYGGYQLNEDRGFDLGIEPGELLPDQDAENEEV